MYVYGMSFFFDFDMRLSEAREHKEANKRIAIL